MTEESGPENAASEIEPSEPVERQAETLRSSPPGERRAFALGMFGLLVAMGLLAWGHVFEVGGGLSRTRLARIRINVNTADVDTLALLPEIGKDRAAKIVEYRTEHGPLRGYPDLLQVTGIGEKTVEKLIHEICFHDEPAPGQSTGER